jgi:site-specific recombinase XerD
LTFPGKRRQFSYTVDLSCHRVNRGFTVKQIPTPQLVRIPDPTLVLIDTLLPKTTTSLESKAIALDSSEAIEPTNNSHETLWEEFLQLQLKPRTRQEYRKSIDYFCRFGLANAARSMAPEQSTANFLSEFLALPKNAAIHLILEWRQHHMNEGKASTTINLRVSAIKSLVEYANKQGACSFSLGEIKSLKTQRYKDSQAVSADEYRSILELVDRSTDLGIRDYAILLMIWDLALSREKVVSLNIWDYLPGRLMMKIKGQFDRQSINLNPQLEEALDHWIAIREGFYFQPKDGSDRADALFLSCNGRRLSGTDIFRILQGYADIAGVHVSPDRVRHGAATANIASNVSMKESKPIVIYQLKIFILDIHPMIWRRIRVSSNSTIADLHYIVQIAMGWTDSHLHRFIINGEEYGISQIGGISFSKDPYKIQLADFRLGEKHRFFYEYDMGDYWQHEILVEKILTSKANNLDPVCISGKRACPPEDCGGAERFMAMVQKQKKSSGRAKKRFEEFDEELVNSRLKQYSMGDPESMLFALTLR